MIYSRLRFFTFSASLSLLGLAAASAGCSSDSDDGKTSNAGGGPSTGGGTGSGGQSSGGQSNTGGQSSTGGGNNAGVVVGNFQVEIVPKSATEGTTGIIGKVYDGPNPSLMKWSLVEEDGDCILEKPKAPFCDPACGADVCVDDNVCQAYPNVKSVGEVKVTGIGASEFALIEVNGSYQKPPTLELSFPPFEAGAAVRFAAAGGDFAPFSVETAAIAPLVVTSMNLALDPAAPLELTWEPAADPSASVVEVNLDISHHGGTKGQVRCETSDDGSLSIGATLIAQLIDLGVAGFPTIHLSRRSVGGAEIEAGRVELTVHADAEMAVEVPGVQSCTNDDECDSGDCRDDLTCG